MLSSFLRRAGASERDQYGLAQAVHRILTSPNRNLSFVLKLPFSAELWKRDAAVLQSLAGHFTLAVDPTVVATSEPVPKAIA